MGGSGETISLAGYGGGLFRIGSKAYTLFSLLHPGSGLIRVTGTGEAFAKNKTTYLAYQIVKPR